MDPNATLSALRNAIEEAPESLDSQLSEIIDLFNGLDTWITKGGFLPTDWAPKPLTVADVTVELSIEPEEMEVHGNACAIDEETDAETERDILDRLSAGDQFAWFCAVVTVTDPVSGVSASDSLGGCSYSSEEGFRDCMMADMTDVALAELNRKLGRVQK